MSKHHCCYSEHHYCSGFYKALICLGNFLAPFLLLILRVFFGVLFAVAGLAKLSDASSVAEFFASVEIPMPLFMVYLVGLVELICGAALVVGFLTRLAVIPLIITMVVAYLTVHSESIYIFQEDPTAIVVEKPFGFLLTSILAFCFGPGVISVDYLIERFVCRDKCDSE